ncbi:MAG: hypothetical protein OCC49_19430 [Fibrobacterales bacterium]
MKGTREVFVLLCVVIVLAACFNESKTGNTGLDTNQISSSTIILGISVPSSSSQQGVNSGTEGTAPSSNSHINSWGGFTDDYIVSLAQNENAVLDSNPLNWSIEDVRASVKPFEFSSNLLYEVIVPHKVWAVNDTVVDTTGNISFERDILYNDTILLVNTHGCGVDVYDRVSGSGIEGEWEMVNLAMGKEYTTKQTCPKIYSGLLTRTYYQGKKQRMVITPNSIHIINSYYRECARDHHSKYFTADQNTCDTLVYSLNGHKRYDRIFSFIDGERVDSERYVGGAETCHLELGDAEQEGYLEEKDAFYECVNTYYDGVAEHERFGLDWENVGWVDTRPETEYVDAETIRDTRDNQTYKIVTIGDQTWMAENLAYDSGEKSRCYNDDPALCDKYGRLYTWWNGMNRVTWEDNAPGFKADICPKGWHIPSHDEWEKLARFIAIDSGDTATFYGRWDAVGRHLKSTNDWVVVDGIEGLDSYGFNAVSTGSYVYSYTGLNEAGFWWSSTETSLGESIGRYLSEFVDHLSAPIEKKRSYKAIRCVEGSVAY